MKFKIATGFDTQTRDEEFTTVEISEAALHQVVTDVVNKMNYDQRTAWLIKLKKEGTATVVT